MKGKKDLEKVVVLGLLLATINVGSVSAAVITSGTADINGTYVGVVADASSDITLNATGDVDFQMNNNSSLINNMKSGASIIVNMNNHNLKSEHAGQLEYIGGSAKKIAILNAYDINIFRDADNTFYNEGTGTEVRVEANHDFIINHTQSGRPPVIVEGKNTTYFIAGNNFTEETPANTAKVLDGATTIYMIANDAKSSVGSLNAAIYTAKSGTINGSVNLNSDAVLTAVKEGVQADNGSVTFAKKATITAPTVIDVLNGGKVTAMNAASAKKLTGDIKSDGANSSADVNLLTSDSFLTGATTVSNSGAVNLEFGNGGIWNVTGEALNKFGE
jgi:hypothetical protein